jgi:hypothetical protein
MQIHHREAITDIEFAIALVNTALVYTERAVMNFYINQDHLKRFSIVLSSLPFLRQEARKRQESGGSTQEAAFTQKLALLKNSLRDDELYSMIVCNSDRGEFANEKLQASMLSRIKHRIVLSHTKDLDKDSRSGFNAFVTTLRRQVVATKFISSKLHQMSSACAIGLQAMNGSGATANNIMALPCDVLSAIMSTLPKSSCCAIRLVNTCLNHEPTMVARLPYLQLLRDLPTMQFCGAHIPGIRPPTHSRLERYAFPHSANQVYLRRSIHIAVGFTSDKWQETVVASNQRNEAQLIPFLALRECAMLRDGGSFSAVCRLVNASDNSPATAYMKPAPQPGPHFNPQGTLPDALPPSVASEIRTGRAVLLSLMNPTRTHATPPSTDSRISASSRKLFGLTFSIHSPSSGGRKEQTAFKFMIQIYYQTGLQHMSARNLCTFTEPFYILANVNETVRLSQHARARAGVKRRNDRIDHAVECVIAKHTLTRTRVRGPNDAVNAIATA